MEWNGIMVSFRLSGAETEDTAPPRVDHRAIVPWARGLGVLSIRKMLKNSHFPQLFHQPQEGLQVHALDGFGVDPVGQRQAGQDLGV